MREAIEDLLADYAEAIDDWQIERWPDFFTEDGVYQIISRESFDAGLPIGILYCEGRGMMHDRVQALRTANIYEPHNYRHLLGRPRIEYICPYGHGTLTEEELQISGLDNPEWTERGDMWDELCAASKDPEPRP